MSTGLCAPVLKKQSSSSSIKSSTKSQKSSEWHCHCCIARNDIDDDLCRVCGRPRSYADAPHLPLHDTGKYILRSDQVATLLPGHRIHDCNEKKWTALHSTAAIGNCDLVEELLVQGSELEATTVEGYTPLHLAVYSGSLETVSVIVKRKANLNAKTFFEQNTPLNIAIQEGWRSVVQYLIDMGADIHLVNAVGRSPLHIAATTGRVDIGTILLHNHAKFDQMDYQGWTPQQVAEYHNHFDFQEILMRCGLKDSQYKITEIKKGEWDTELWNQVVKGRRNREVELESAETAYDVSSVRTGSLALLNSKSLYSSSMTGSSTADNTAVRETETRPKKGSIFYKGTGLAGDVKPPGRGPPPCPRPPPRPALSQSPSSRDMMTSGSKGAELYQPADILEQSIGSQSYPFMSGDSSDNISVVSDLSRDDGSVTSSQKKKGGTESRHAAAARRNMFS